MGSGIKYSFLIFVFFITLTIFFIFPSSTQAVTTDKSSYVLNEAINFTSHFEEGFLVIYDLNQTVNQSQYDCGTELADTFYPILPDDGWCVQTPNAPFFDNIPAASYSFIEIDLEALPYQDCRELSYTDCKNAAVFYEEIFFTITLPSTPSTPSDTGGGTPAYRPTVEIISPSKGDSFSQIVTIEYEVTDQNDLDRPSVRDWLGLGDTPVSIFYSETSDIREKKLIVENLSPLGSYQWEVEEISSGNDYRIIIEAVDNVGEIGKRVSDAFLIDHGAPMFTIKVDPPLSRGENVNLSIESSEDLVKPPVVSVRQRAFQSVKVEIRGEKKDFEGIYQVVAGYDGTAVISISGEDVAGNVGTTIIEGETFSINVEPPPKPVIVSPLDKDIIITETISVVGNVREDVDIILKVNGLDEYQTKPDEEGNFIFENVKIDPDFNRGINFLSIISRDAANNSSEQETISLKFNFEPEISILSPRRNNVISNKSSIAVAARDRNEDLLTFTFEVSNDDGKNWTVLQENLKEMQYQWETTQFPDGHYIVRVTTDDGFTQIILVSGTFLVRNFLPVISFVADEKIITSQKDTVIKGSVAIPRESERDLVIIDVEYSLNQGEEWTDVTASDGAFDSFKEEFSFLLVGLKEGLYSILVRAKDSRGLYGRASQLVIVDFGPPPRPTITLPRSREIFGDKDDLDKDKAGVQIRVKGKAEANNKLLATNGEFVFEGSSDAAGNYDIEITLREHGENIVKVSSIDPAENKSISEAILAVIYNNPPTLEFLQPRVNGGVNHLTDIIFEIQDKDLDIVEESLLSYRRAGEIAKIILAKDISDNVFSWNVSGYREGLYELILEASDGVSKNSITRQFYIDNRPPQVRFEPLKKNVFTESFTLEMRGTAEDNLSGIEYVEFSMDSENWFKVLITSGYQTPKAGFRMRYPFKLQDGVYQVVFRATDVSGNISLISEGQEIVIDTSSPKIGSYTLSIGSLILFPEKTFFKILEGIKVKFVISLERDTQEAMLIVGEQTISLTKNVGLWEAEILFSDLGVQPLFVSAEDFSGNKTENKDIGAVEVIPKGRVVFLKDGKTEEVLDEVKISILLFNESAQSWIRWQAESYGFLNPLFTDQEGKYELSLPEGTYQIILQKSGFQKLKISGLNLLNPRFITFDFELKQREGIRGFFEDLLEKIIFKN